MLCTLCGRGSRRWCGRSRSASGSPTPSGHIGALVIDEASQAGEIDSLIPFSMLLGSNVQSKVPRIALLGDPKQLPVTVMAEEPCARERLSTSLMERMLMVPEPRRCRVEFLNTQYRMAPPISSFVSKTFYSGRLLDSASVTERASSIPAAFLRHGKLASLMFVDEPSAVESKVSRDDGYSASNRGEAMAIARVLAAWQKCQPIEPKAPLSVLVITPYRAQQDVLRRELAHAGLWIGGWEATALRTRSPGYIGSLPPPATFEVCTIDGGQGREADVVVLSTVVRTPRKGKNATIGFLSDPRRACVALSRARDALWVFGSSSVLSACPLWSSWLAHCRSAGRLAAGASSLL